MYFTCCRIKFKLEAQACHWYPLQRQGVFHKKKLFTVCCIAWHSLLKPYPSYFTINGYDACPVIIPHNGRYVLSLLSPWVTWCCYCRNKFAPVSSLGLETLFRLKEYDSKKDHYSEHNVILLYYVKKYKSIKRTQVIWIINISLVVMVLEFYESEPSSHSRLMFVKQHNVFLNCQATKSLYACKIRFQNGAEWCLDN